MRKITRRSFLAAAAACGAAAALTACGGSSASSAAASSAAPASSAAASAAVDGQKRTFAPCAVEVDQAGRELLAGSRFSQEKYGDIRRGQAPGLIHYLAHFFASINDIVRGSF